MTHHVLCTESSPTPSNSSPNRLLHTTPQPMCDKTSFWMTSNDHFQNKISIVCNPKAFWMIHHNDHFLFKIHFMFKTILCSNSYAFVWVAYFLCRTVGSANPDTFTTFHCWRLCLTIIDGLFTRGRIYPFLLIPDTYFLYHFNQLCDFI